ncbi:MAG: hypothetical protein ACKVVT_19085 [Dehalococcoidia bacterium]
MADLPVPNHVLSARRDGKREVILHRSVARISEQKIEIKSARATVWLPLVGLAIAAGLGTWIAMAQGAAPFWLLAAVLLLLILFVPVCVMGLVSAIAGADIIIDGRKGAATWQQGYLGMGIGTKELVPFAKADYIEVTIEGADSDRWHDLPDDLRQFALTLVKKSGKRLKLAQVPVPAYGQEDGMDRTLAVGNAVAALMGVEVRLPEGWELVEVDADTLAPVAADPATPVEPTANEEPAASPRQQRRKRR